MLLTFHIAGLLDVKEQLILLLTCILTLVTLVFFFFFFFFSGFNITAFKLFLMTLGEHQIDSCTTDGKLHSRYHIYLSHAGRVGG